MKINYDDTTPIPKSDYGMIAHIVSWGSIGDRACGYGLFVPESFLTKDMASCSFGILKCISVSNFDINMDFQK